MFLKKLNVLAGGPEAFHGAWAFIKRKPDINYCGMKKPGFGSNRGGLNKPKKQERKYGNERVKYDYREGIESKI